MTVTVPGLNEKDPVAFARAIQQLAAGRSNAFGTVTLAVGAASTTVTNKNCAAGTVPILTPATANAAAAQATTYVPIASVGNGSFVIQHANNAQADRTFLYALHG
jgi:hypothetical protein